MSMLYAHLVFQIWSAPADYEELATSSSLSMSRAVKAGTVKKNINVYSFRYLPFFQHVNRQTDLDRFNLQTDIHLHVW